MATAYLSTYSTATSVCWDCWNSTATATTIPVWDQWIASTATNTYTTQAWKSWNTLGSQKPCPNYAAQQQQLEAIRLEQERQMNRYRVEVAAVEAKRAAAEKRAGVLLESVLSPQECKRLADSGYFIVRGRSGCRYRIRRGRSGNIDVVDKEGFITARLCAHPVLHVPDSDTMLAQKLMLEHDEAAFLKVANRTPITRGERRTLEALN